ncbi:MAG: zinc-binding dehydrogenase [Candidatus Latescibacteria bacterium]|jgi:threonine dehydrogenase-like Zn-dependent dehydrogenase|nr:zinc-binding dehydrogenase [Candidatus Latescibacterota bacterium]
MKKVVITGERNAELVDCAEPVAKGNWVVVKVHVAPMCTEYTIFLDGDVSSWVGHEAVGEVVEVAQPGRVAVGDRVVAMPLTGCGVCALCVSGDYIHCQNAPGVEESTGSAEGVATMAHYLVKPDWLLLRVPDHISDERAGIYCCGLGPTMSALELMNITAYETVLITGLGPVGLGGVVNAKFRGSRVIGVESAPWRVELALKMGAEAVIDPSDSDALEQIVALTDGVGVDCAIDCSGTVAAERMCIDAVRIKGRVAFVGECGQELSVVASSDFIRKGLTIYGSWHYNLNLFPKIMHVIENSPLTSLLSSHTFPMSGIQQAFELQTTRQSAKVLLRPWE